MIFKSNKKLIISSILFTSILSIDLLAEVNYSRNPFVSLINKKISNYQSITVTKQASEKNLPLIRRYSLDKYDILGVIKSRTTEIILVLEKYSGKKFYLKKLDFIGNQDEQIINIERNKIVLGKFDPDTNRYVETNFILINRNK